MLKYSFPQPVSFGLRACVTLLAVAVCSQAAAEEVAQTAPSPLVTLSPHDIAAIEAWYNTLEPFNPEETFGHLVARAALTHRGKPYYDPPPAAEPEVLTIRLDDFQCVSIIESSIAVARCLTQRTANSDCFVREVAASRYRGGTIAGFSSKLHYFDEWITDNARRGRLLDLTAQLGGHETPRSSDYVTRHARRYPALADANVVAEMKKIEASLRQTEAWVIDRAQVRQAQAHFETGDIIAVVSARPGLLISHAAIVYRDGDAPRLLHASSHHHRVVLSTDSVASYIMRRPERIGVMVARPRFSPPSAHDPTAAK